MIRIFAFDFLLYKVIVEVHRAEGVGLPNPRVRRSEGIHSDQIAHSITAVASG